jgi:hypothetical protein
MLTNCNCMCGVSKTPTATLLGKQVIHHTKIGHTQCWKLTDEELRSIYRDRRNKTITTPSLKLWRAQLVASPNQHHLQTAVCSRNGLHPNCVATRKAKTFTYLEQRLLTKLFRCLLYDTMLRWEETIYSMIYSKLRDLVLKLKADPCSLT